MAVHAGEVAAAGEDLTGRLLIAQEPRETALESILVAIGLGVSKSCAQERQEAKAGGAAVGDQGFHFGASGALALAARVQAPAAVGPLVTRDPVYPALDGLLGFFRATLAPHQLRLRFALP